MRKILSILLAVVMVLSLVAPFRVNTAKAVSGLNAKDQYTWLPTYKVGQPIVGTTNSPNAVEVALYKSDGSTLASTTSPNPFTTNGAGAPFYFNTTGLSEGTYILRERDSSHNDISGTEKKVYIQEFSLPTPTCSTTPAFGVSGALIYGNLYYANTGSPVQNFTLTLL